MLWDQNTCRLCLSKSLSMQYIFEQTGIEMKLQRYLRLDVQKCDSKPDEICKSCCEKLDDIAAFIDMCHESNKKFESILNQNILQKCNNEYVNLSSKHEQEEGVSANVDLIKTAVNLNRNLNIVLTESTCIRNQNDVCSNPSVVRHSSEYVNNLYSGVLHVKVTQNEPNKSAEVTCNTIVQCKKIDESAASKSEEIQQIGEGTETKTAHSKDTKGKKPVEKKYHCDHCQKPFTRKQNLQYHISMHSDQFMFKCDQCAKTFSTKWNLTCHKRTHTDLYRCKYCNKTFSFKSKLDRHIRTHTNNRPFVCQHPGCTKSFSDKRNLATHVLIHSDAKNYNCLVCNKNFRTLKELKQHNRVHDDKAPFKCTVCSKTYKYNTNLFLHMKKHDGYYCKFCKIDFLKLSKLLRHRKECKLNREK